MERFRKTHKESYTAKESAEIVLWQIKKVLHCHFPALRERLKALADPRKGVEYSIEALVMASIVLFLLKCDSRNSFNNKLRDSQFCKNYRRYFHFPPPSMDAVNDFYEKLAPEELEDLRRHLISGLIEKRVFHRLRFFKDCYFCVAVDATGAYNWGDNPPESIRPYALKKESKKESKKKSKKESRKKAEEEAPKEVGEEAPKESGRGKISYSSQVLEAVLVCNNGMVIPLASEWIANDGEKYDKQDCELKAFKRLAVRLKNYFPQLSICILADGLYSNVAMMDVCRQNGWKFITVFKDGNLPSVWEEVESLLPLAGGAETCRQMWSDSMHWITYHYRWIKGIEYHNHLINWIECVQETVHRKTGGKGTHRFVFLSTLEVNSENVKSIVMAGRSRWSIEDYFNSQKNRGGALHHKFNRNDFKALKNWHNVRQLACIINELAEYTKELRQLLKENAKMTLKELWENLISFLKMHSVEVLCVEFECWSTVHRQVRLE